VQLRAQADTIQINEKLDQSYDLQTTNADLAVHIAKEALQQSEEIKYARGIADASMRLGYMLYVRGQYDSSLAFLKKAFNLRNEYGDFSGAIGTATILGYVYNATGEKDSAFLYLFESLHLADKVKEPKIKASAFVTIGSLYSSYDETDLALNYTQKGKEIYSELNDKNGLALSASALGVIQFKLKKYDAALMCFLQSDSLFKRFNDPYAIARNTNNIALCYDAMSQHSLAKNYYYQAERSFQELNMQENLAIVYNNIGAVFFNEKILDSASIYFNKGIHTSKEIGAREIELKSLEHLADVYKQKGDYKKAFIYQTRYLALNDSLIDNEKVKQIAEMQTKYETEKQIQENKLLDAENKVHATQRNVFIIASILLFLGLVFLAVFVIQRIRLAKRNREIAQKKIENLLNDQELTMYKGMIEGQEEERKRIAKDLHDRVGSMLSTVKMLFSSLDTAIAKTGSDNVNQFKKTNQVLDNAVSEVRQVSHNLSTGMVTSFGLISALEELCATINSSNLITCKLLVYGLEGRFNQQIEVGLYRMIQEILSNILKHAKAKNINIMINKTEDSLNISVEDDGVGFDVEAIRNSKKAGIGLANLEARAASLNGSYFIDSQSGKGAISIIELPLTTLDQ